MRRNWRGGKYCVFCTQPESIYHLFFEWHFAKFMWIAAYIAFNIPKPYSILHLFNGWATTGGLKNRKLCFIGAAALICVLWTSRNNLVFDNSPTKTYMQVLFRGTYWLRQWAQLQWREDMVKCCCRHAACWRRWHFSFSWTLVGTSEIELAHLSSYDGVHGCNIATVCGVRSLGSWLVHFFCFMVWFDVSVAVISFKRWTLRTFAPLEMNA
jgi:hypothetical protein